MCIRDRPSVSAATGAMSSPSLRAKYLSRGGPTAGRPRRGAPSSAARLRSGAASAVGREGGDATLHRTASSVAAAAPAASSSPPPADR
eukprot:2656074-Pyramimonas_sp.AAC.2